MSVSSRPARAPRRLPQQERGQRRVAALLKATASVITDSGYDGATMAEIAQRAGACIGSLYQFFPNKQSITEALRAKYREESGTLWASLEDGDSIALEELATRLVDEMVIFLDERPALLHLFSVPCNPRDTSIRDLLRERLCRILLAAVPQLSKPRAALVSSVCMQIMKALNELYAETERTARKPLVREYEQVLSCYLKTQLRDAKASGTISIKRKVVPAH